MPRGKLIYFVIKLVSKKRLWAIKYYWIKCVFKGKKKDEKKIKNEWVDYD